MLGILGFSLGEWVILTSFKQRNERSHLYLRKMNFSKRDEFKTGKIECWDQEENSQVSWQETKNDEGQNSEMEKRGPAINCLLEREGEKGLGWHLHSFPVLGGPAAERADLEMMRKCKWLNLLLDLLSWRGLWNVPMEMSTRKVDRKTLSSE